jgi:hypothetical protein
MWCGLFWWLAPPVWRLDVFSVAIFRSLRWLWIGAEGRVFFLKIRLE